MSKIKRNQLTEARVVLTNRHGFHYWHDGAGPRGAFDSADSARFDACIALASQARVVVFVDQNGRRI